MLYYSRKEAVPLYEWHEAVQKMVDWLEAHLTEEPTLLNLSAQVGYSPWYCSTQFHRLCGMTVKRYVAHRKLALAALDLRDTPERIIDIAVKYGFSSQEAFTRAFRGMFGRTPAAYRRDPAPLPLPTRKVVFDYIHYQRMNKGGVSMSISDLHEANVRVEYIPAHSYLGIFDQEARNYCDFWQGRDCDEICGTINSMSHVSDPIITGHTAGWYRAKDGERRYFYGTGVPANYAGRIPAGFDRRDLPGGYYLVFFHPPFNYMEDNGDVMGRVEGMAWNFDLTAYCGGRYEWNEDVCNCYQRHYPEVIGYEVLRPIRLK